MPWTPGISPPLNPANLTRNMAPIIMIVIVVPLARVSKAFGSILAINPPIIMPTPAPNSPSGISHPIAIGKLIPFAKLSTPKMANLE